MTRIEETSRAALQECGAALENFSNPAKSSEPVRDEREVGNRCCEKNIDDWKDHGD